MGLSTQGGAGGATTFLSSVTEMRRMSTYERFRASAPPGAQNMLDELRGTAWIWAA